VKPSIVAAILLGLAPFAALAQTSDARTAVPPAAPAQAAAPTTEPTGPWSLGAGVGWPTSSPQYYFLGGSLFPPTAPMVRASLERAMAPGWWWEAGFEGSANRLRGEAPDASGAATRDDRVSAAMNLGVRRAVTRPGAPVTVSIDLALVAGYIATHVDRAYITPEIVRGEAWQVGLSAGLAVERELTSGLSLRVGTTLLNASWTRSSIESSVNGKATQQGGGATLGLSPWLELRQAF
jgi:hypothetical protein